MYLLINSNMLLILVGRVKWLKTDLPEKNQADCDNKLVSEVLKIYFFKDGLIEVTKKFKRNRYREWKLKMFLHQLKLFRMLA